MMEIRGLHNQTPVRYTQCVVALGKCYIGGYTLERRWLRSELVTHYTIYRTLSRWQINNEMVCNSGSSTVNHVELSILENWTNY